MLRHGRTILSLSPFPNISSQLSACFVHGTDNIPLQLLLCQIQMSEGLSTPQAHNHPIQLQPLLPFQSVINLFPTARGHQRQGLLWREEKMTKKQKTNNIIQVMQVNHHHQHSVFLLGKFHMSQISPNAEQSHSGILY